MAVPKTSALIARPLTVRKATAQERAAMSDTPFIKFYPSDFLGGTSGLSPAERGCYITLLCLIYEADGPIARDDRRLARRCGAAKATFTRILEALIAQGKITQTGGKLFNRRAEKALTDRQNRVKNSIAAANIKWSAQSQKAQQKQGKNDAAASATQCGEVCQPEPEPELEYISTSASLEGSRDHDTQTRRRDGNSGHHGAHPQHAPGDIRATRTNGTAPGFDPAALERDSTRRIGEFIERASGSHQRPTAPRDPWDEAEARLRAKGFR